MDYEIVIREMNASGEQVREKSIMKTNHKHRAVSYFNEELARLSYYLKTDTQILLVEHIGDGVKIIRRGNS